MQNLFEFVSVWTFVKRLWDDDNCSNNYLLFRNYINHCYINPNKLKWGIGHRNRRAHSCLYSIQRNIKVAIWKTKAVGSWTHIPIDNPVLYTACRSNIPCTYKIAPQIWDNIGSGNMGPVACSVLSQPIPKGRDSMRIYCQSNHSNQLKWNLNQNTLNAFRPSGAYMRQ